MTSVHNNILKGKKKIKSVFKTKMYLDGFIAFFSNALQHIESVNLKTVLP